jgi:hypothetical protein
MPRPLQRDRCRQSVTTSRLDSNWGGYPVNEIEPVSDGHFAMKVPRPYRLFRRMIVSLAFLPDSMMAFERITNLRETAGLATIAVRLENGGRGS